MTKPGTTSRKRAPKEKPQDTPQAEGKDAPKVLDYVAKANGWAAGRRVKAGEIVPLTERQARHETNLTLPAKDD